MRRDEIWIYIVHIQGARVCGKHSEHLGRVWKKSIPVARSGEQPTHSVFSGQWLTGGWVTAGGFFFKVAVILAIGLPYPAACIYMYSYAVALPP